MSEVKGRQQKTHHILAGIGTNSGQHLPNTIDKVAKLREILGVLLREQFGYLTDRRADLLEWSWRIIVILLVSCVISISHIPLELWTFPA